MTTVSDSRPAPLAEQLRSDLIDQLRAENIVNSPSVEAALRHVPRHIVRPRRLAGARAYVDGTVRTKSDVDGAALSMASQPRIVAMMGQGKEGRAQVFRFRPAGYQG
ncbi:hypothetical protein [Saccharopolyspora phatthalungensis]|uniref:Protein-L-isoaspartate O-methyltransferase n=1 Tax=Saccharopolyspora phatthalungensis TaxID=664693 RepID=A0A840QFP0_9PSEU|nr:hypothetical protein [Saccharopolyspora phatthalungensis]MBB5159654.1 protein-L-isoaspartate O-methyltransferase [Saccharopolyspora phatthalungensis]